MNRPVEKWENQILDIQARLDDGDHAALQELYESKDEAPDHTRSRWVRLVIAQSELSRDNKSAALPILRELHTTQDIDEYGAKALYLEATTFKDKNAEMWLKKLEETIVKYPDEIAAENALEDIVKHYENTANFEGLHSKLDAIYPKINTSFLADNILFLSAQNADQNLKKYDQAIVYYARIWRDHRSEGLADDALWEIAQLHIRFQMWQPAIRNLIVFTESGESSWFVGSYDSPFVADSMLELGHIYIHLGEFENAWHWFNRFVTEYDDSFRAPNAAWLAAECLRLQKRDAEHLSAMRELVEIYPESSWAKRAQNRIGSGNTP